MDTICSDSLITKLSATITGQQTQHDPDPSVLMCLLCGTPAAPHGGMNFVEQTHSLFSQFLLRPKPAGRGQGAQLRNTAPPKTSPPPTDGGCAAPLETFKALHPTAFMAAAKPK